MWSAPVDGRLIDVIAPATEEPIARVALGGEQDIDRAVRAARAAFDEGSWVALGPQGRAEYLQRFGDAIAARAEEFAQIIAREVGTPIGPDATRHTSAHICKMFIDYHVGLATTYPWVEQRTGLVADAEIRREPVGVVGAIVPWNVPLFLTIAKLAPAFLAGCTVVLKPAEETPLNAFMLADIAAEVGIPEGVFSVVPADRQISESLVRHPLVDKISFTGSTRAGKTIASVCGEQLKRYSLELGGKSAAIILPDADVEQTLSSLVPNTIHNSGQVCVNQTRVLAPRALYDDVVDGMTAAYSAMVVGDPLDPATNVGPLITAAQRERVEGYIAAGRQQNARMTVGGGRPDHDRGYYVEPTVFADVDNSMKIAREEIFGPVVSIIRYDTEDEAVAIANDSPYGLSGTVWSSDQEHAERIARQVRTGNIGSNIFMLDFAAPFGGFKESGIGREYGPEGVTSFTETQALHRPKRS